MAFDIHLKRHSLIKTRIFAFFLFHHVIKREKMSGLYTADILSLIKAERDALAKCASSSKSKICKNVYCSFLVESYGFDLQ